MVPAQNNYFGLDYNSFSSFFFFTFWPPTLRCVIFVPWPGIEPELQHWKHRVLTTGPLGKSLDCNSYTLINKIFQSANDWAFTLLDS